MGVGSFLRWVAVALTAVVVPASAQTPIGAARLEKEATLTVAASSASAPRRILLVDDDGSHNNASRGADQRLSASDAVYRRLVAQAVGGDSKAWEAEVVPTNSRGPGLDRLRAFDLVVWYTGGSYGGNPDNTAVLGLEDEKSVRRYLEEAGGSFVLISPGYLGKVAYGSTWERSAHPFVTEVLGVQGFAGLLQRFKGGAVETPEGQAFAVQPTGAAEAQFSAANPASATAVFTAMLDPTRKAIERVPVAVVNAYGGGRIVYVGFTLENVAERELAPAFAQVLAAANPPSRTAAAPAAPAVPAAPEPMLRELSAPPANRNVRLPPPPPTSPAGALTNLRIITSLPGQHSIGWDYSSDYYGPNSKFTVYRRTPDGSWRPLPGDAVQRTFTDYALLPGPTAYKVVYSDDDNRRSEAIVEYPNPPQPAPIPRFGFEQKGPGTVWVGWGDSPVTAGQARVFAPGLPAEGQVVPTRSVTLTNLPVGVHEVRVREVWGTVESPHTATTRILVKPDRGRYRLLYRGLQVVRQADDDILNLDGRGNEVRVGAVAVTHTFQDRTPTYRFAGSAVMGDVQGRPDRVQAGTASPQGGLRTGDTFPTDAIVPRIGITPAPDRFPLLVWDGELAETGPWVAVLPIALEWGAERQDTFAGWAQGWTQPGPRRVEAVTMAMGLLRNDPPTPVRAIDFTASVQPADRPTVVVSYSTRPGHERPIGLSDWTSPGQNGLLFQKGFFLSYANAELALGLQPAIMLSIPWVDSGSGHYVAHFQLERLSPPPPVMPETPSAVQTTSIGILPMPTTVVAPAPAPAATAPAVSQFGTPTAQPATTTLKPPADPPAGPAPGRLTYQSRGPSRNRLTWDDNGAARFDVLRQEGDRWQVVATNVDRTVVEDRTFIAPGTVYEVVGHHADGRVGRSRVTATNPTPPVTLSQVVAEQTGVGEITLRWTASDLNDGHYARVGGPGLPESARIEVNDDRRSATVRGLPPGTYSFLVEAIYDPLVAPGRAGTAATVVPWRPLAYRLVLLGFEVGRKTTDDDILDFDGRGDEVFFGGATFTNDAKTDTIRSVVMGDVNGHPGRVRVGSAGPTGGIRSGDVVPSAAALQPQPGVAVQPGGLPLLLWSGPLGNEGYVAIPFAGFEWDPGPGDPFKAWESWLTSPQGRDARNLTARIAGLRTTRIAYEPLAISDSYVDYDVRPVETRMLGTNRGPANQRSSFIKGFVLTRANVEHVLAGRPAAVLEFPLNESPGPQDEEYTIVVQVEKIPGGPLP